MREQINERKSSSIISFLTQSQIDVRETRDVFIGTCLSKVCKEHGKSLKDKIDLQTETKPHKKYLICHADADEPSFRICRECGGSSKKPSVSCDFTPYEQLIHTVLSTISCKAGEPDFLNVSPTVNDHWDWYQKV